MEWLYSGISHENNYVKTICPIFTLHGNKYAKKNIVPGTYVF